MRLYDKIKMWLDYNNHYTLNKALNILAYELSLAQKNKDIARAKEVMEIARDISETLSDTYRESADYGNTMSYSQKLFSRRIKHFIEHASQSMRKEFNLPNLETLINEIQ